MHKTGGLSQVPRTLRLIEDDNVLYGWSRIGQHIIAKVVDVLNERFDTLADLSLSRPNAAALLTCNFITGECFPEYRDKWTVAREEYRMGRLVGVSPVSGNIQTHQGLTGSRYTRDEGNEFASLCPCLVHKLFNTARGNVQIPRTCIVTCDGFNRMLGVESLCCFHNGRRWIVGSLPPSLFIEYFARHRSQSQVDCLSQPSGMGWNRAIDMVIVGVKFRRSRFRSLRSDKDRYNRGGMTGFVEVLQIQSIVPHLIHGGPLEYPLAHFELDDEDDRTNQENRINPSAHTRNAELQKHRTRQADKAMLQ